MREMEGREKRENGYTVMEVKTKAQETKKAGERGELEDEREREGYNKKKDGKEDSNARLKNRKRGDSLLRLSRPFCQIR